MSKLTNPSEFNGKCSELTIFASEFLAFAFWISDLEGVLQSLSRSNNPSEGKSTFNFCRPKIPPSEPTDYRNPVVAVLVRF